MVERTGPTSPKKNLSEPMGAVEALTPNNVYLRHQGTLHVKTRDHRGGEGVRGGRRGPSNVTKRREVVGLPQGRTAVVRSVSGSGANRGRRGITGIRSSVRTTDPDRPDPGLQTKGKPRRTRVKGEWKRKYPGTTTVGAEVGRHPKTGRRAWVPSTGTKEGRGSSWSPDRTRRYT